MAFLFLQILYEVCLWPVGFVTDSPSGTLCVGEWVISLNGVGVIWLTAGMVVDVVRGNFWLR